MIQALAVFAVFMSLIAAALFANIPTKVYSQLPFVPSSPSSTVSTDNNTSSAATTTSNQSSSTTNTTTASQQQQEQQQEIEGFSTYQDPSFGFTVQYPSNWTVVSSDVTPSMVEQNTENPEFGNFQCCSI